MKYTVVALVALLVACGGGGGEDAPSTELRSEPAEVLKATVTSYPAWYEWTRYMGGDRVSHKGKNYEALPASNNTWNVWSPPDWTATLWKELPPETVAVPPPTTGFDTFVIAGQSNTYVGAPLDPNLDGPHPAIVEYTAEGQTIPAKDPLQSLGGRNGGNIGFAMSFAKAYVAANPTRKVVLVHCGYAGAGFSTPSPNTWTIGAGNLPARCISKANAALAATGGVMKGFLWHQGETDFGANSTYAAKLDGLIAHFRAQINGASQAPFVVGGLADAFVATGGATGAAFQQIIANTPSRVAKAAFASSAGLATQDGVHFSAPSHRILGVRYHTAFASVSSSTPAPAPVLAEWTEQKRYMAGDRVSRLGKYYEATARSNEPGVWNVWSYPEWTPQLWKQITL